MNLIAYIKLLLLSRSDYNMRMPSRGSKVAVRKSVASCKVTTALVHLISIVGGALLGVERTAVPALRNIIVRTTLVSIAENVESYGSHFLSAKYIDHIY